MKKILALTLVFALLFTMVSNSFGVFATESVVSVDNGSGQTVYQKYIPADMVGYVSEPENIIMYKSDMNTHVHANRAKARPVIAPGEGVDGSTAMRMGSDEFGFARFPVTFRVEDNVLAKGNTFTVRFSVKVVSGKLDKLYAGVTTTNINIKNNWDTAYISPTYYTSDDLPIGVWKTVEYTAATDGSWNRLIYINPVAEETGVILLVDNIEVFDATANDNLNLFVSTNVIMNSNNTPYSGGAYYVGTFDKPNTSQVDSIGYFDSGNIVMYKALGAKIGDDVRRRSRPMLAPEMGINGSTAIRVGTMETAFEKYPLVFRFSPDYSGNKTYKVKFSIKVIKGSIKNLYAGVTIGTENLNGTADEYAAAYVSQTVYNSQQLPLNQWVDVEFSASYSRACRYLYINIDASESGAIALIDNIELYNETAADNLNLFVAENVLVASLTPYSGGAEFVGTFDKPYCRTDNTPVPGTMYSKDYLVYKNELGLSTVGHKLTGTNKSNTDSGNAPKLSDLGEGVKGSYALEIGGSNAIESGQYVVNFHDQFRADEFPSGYKYWDSENLLAGVKVRVEADIKVKSGEVSELKMGILASQTKEKSLYSINSTYLSDSWNTFSWTQTIYSSYTYEKECDLPDCTYPMCKEEGCQDEECKNSEHAKCKYHSQDGEKQWFYFSINLATVNEGGATVLIDNIRVYAEGDDTKHQIFKRSDYHNFNFDVESFTPILKDPSTSIYTPSFNPSDVRIGEGTTGDAKVVCMENAHSGDYALAIGYGDQNLTNCRVRYGIRELLPNRNYRISFAMSVSGKSFSEVRVELNSSVGGNALTHICLRGSDNPVDGSLITECPRKWTEISVDAYETGYTDDKEAKDYFGNMLERAGWNYLEFTFVDGEKYDIGDSAMFIDSVSIRELNENGEEIGPNLFMDGSFEYIPNTYDWESYESPFWSGSADDFTFMSGIEKELAAYSATVEDGIEEFETILNSEPYKNFDSFFIGAYKRDVMLYEAQKLKAADKKVWLSLTNFIRSERVEGIAGVVEDYKELILAAASELQLICGDNFQGFYFDEPGYYLTDEKFIEITKWLRETFKKRVFAIHYKETVNGIEHTVKEELDENGNITYIPSGSLLAITKETHKYVTDVGYWRYGSWEESAEKALTNFSNFCLGDDPAINIETRKWMVPLLGRHSFDQTGTHVATLIQNMYDGFEKLPNFGGIGFFSLGISDKTSDYRYKTVGGVNKLQDAIDSGALPEGQFKINSEKIDGNYTVINYTFLQYGGYYMLNSNPNLNSIFKDSYKVRTLVDNIISEFKSYNKLYAEENLIFGDKLLTFNAGVTVQELLTSLAVSDEAVRVMSADTVLIAGDTVKSGDIISIDTPMGTIERIVVKRYDANSDGLLNAVDIVRCKRVAVEITDATDIGNMAVTAKCNGRITVSDIGKIREELMK